jgi:hypothetical protein
VLSVGLGFGLGAAIASNDFFARWKSGESTFGLAGSGPIFMISAFTFAMRFSGMGWLLKNCSTDVPLCSFASLSKNSAIARGA